MKPELPANRTCPKCGSGDYRFRHRKTIVLKTEKGDGVAMETKYRCKACQHEWKVTTPIQPAN